MLIPTQVTQISELTALPDIVWGGTSRAFTWVVLVCLVTPGGLVGCICHQGAAASLVGTSQGTAGG